MKKVAAALFLFCLVLVSGELFARFFLGLGTPALTVIHPSIEYLFLPNQDVSRFGNRIFINQYGMRSEPLPAVANDSNKRVMVFGDSVLFGGNQVDQSRLATSILQNHLRTSWQDTYVGNISANSWGPGNWLAYANEYGFFNAEVIALILSGHDQTDNPTFTELSPTSHPTKAPASALVEAVSRYTKEYLKPSQSQPHTASTSSSSDKRHIKTSDRADVANNTSDTNDTSDAKNTNDTRHDANNTSDANDATHQAISDLIEFLQKASKASTRVLVFYHPERSEFETDSPEPGYQTIAGAVQSLGINFIPLAPYYRQASESPSELYLDPIHPSVLGQAAIASALIDHVSLSAPQ